MRRLIRENALPLCGALLALLLMSAIGAQSRLPRDFRLEALASFSALLHGHPLAFLRLAPAYGGSLVERAPFALLRGLFGRGPEALYEAVALPGLLASAALGLWLVARMRRGAASGGADAAGSFARLLVLALCIANPFALQALRTGHPEELVGGALCVGAVLLAASGRSVMAGALLGLAIANKEWALLAVPAALLALPPRPMRSHAALLLTCALGAALVLAPLLLVPGGSFYAQASAAASPASVYVFMPWSLWWFLGSPGGVPFPSAFGRFVVVGHHPVGYIAPGYRVAPAWVASISHPSILIAGAALGAAALWQQRRSSAGASVRGAAGVRGGAQAAAAGRRDRLALALTLLALLMLVRCLLDTWDNLYYPLPCLLALLALDAHSHPRRPPLLAGVIAALGAASFSWLPPLIAPDLQSLFFLAWSLPLALYLAIRLYAPTRAWHRGPTSRVLAAALGAGRGRAPQSSIS